MAEESQEQVSAQEEQETAGPTPAEAVDTEETVIEGEIVEEGAPEQVASAEAEPKADECAMLRTQLAEAQAKVDEYLDGWQRSRAEFINFKRREEQRRQQVEEDIRARVLVRVLHVLDDMERAFQSIPQDMRENPWVTGLSLVWHELEATMEKEGVSAIPTQPGDAFDPTFHEAVTHEPSDAFEEGQIVDVVRQGYKLNHNVLRPALVRVSSGKLVQ